MSGTEQMPDVDTQNQQAADADPQQTGNSDQSSDPAQSSDVQQTEQPDQDDPAVVNIIAQAGGDPTDPVQIKMAKRIREKDSLITKLSETPAPSGQDVQKPKSIADLLAQDESTEEPPGEEDVFDTLNPDSVDARIDKRVREAIEKATKRQEEEARLTRQEQEIINDPVLGKAYQAGHYGEFLDEVRNGHLNTIKSTFATYLFSKGLHPGINQVRNGLRNQVTQESVASISEGANASGGAPAPKYGPGTLKYLEDEHELPDPSYMPHDT